MKVLVIEDEELVAERLVKLLDELDDTIQIEACLDSIEDVVEWLKNHPMPDLLFLDIQLSDGLSFEIFKKVEVKSPIIFTTAYDQYAIQAFKVNSIDYLLKPVSIHDLRKAMDKFKLFTASKSPGVNLIDLKKLAEDLKQVNKNYKTRFLVKTGDRMQFKNVSDIHYFYADGKEVYMVVREGRKFLIEYRLDELENLLEHSAFFRLNRKFIIHINSVTDVRTYSNGRLKLELTPDPGEVIVSRERVGQFKEWLDR